MTDSPHTFALVHCSYRCRLCKDVITATEGGEAVACQCGASAVDLLDSQKGLMRRQGNTADFISLCVWRNRDTGEVVHDSP
jgi:hypothetical protein